MTVQQSLAREEQKEDSLPPQRRPASRTMRHIAGSVLARREFAISAVGILLFLYFSIVAGGFFSQQNFIVLTQFLAPISVLAGGQVFLLVCGEVDLSAGTVFVFIPFVLYYAYHAGAPFGVAVVLAILLSIGIGVLNGAITVFARVPSFVTTLGALFAIDGIMEITSNGLQEPLTVPGWAGQVFGTFAWSEVIWALVIAAILHITLTKTRFGLHTVAIGGNPLGAVETGISEARVKILNFALCSTVAGLAGIIDAVRITSLDPGNNGTLEFFYGISAAVIGGTALTGGSGTVVGALIGAVVLGILYDGLSVTGVSAYAFDVVLGLAVLAAMVAGKQLSVFLQRRGSRGAR